MNTNFTPEQKQDIIHLTSWDRNLHPGLAKWFNDNFTIELPDGLTKIKWVAQNKNNFAGITDTMNAYLSLVKITPKN